VRAGGGDGAVEAKAYRRAVLEDMSTWAVAAKTKKREPTRRMMDLAEVAARGLPSAINGLKAGTRPRGSDAVGVACSLPAAKGARTSPLSEEAAASDDMDRRRRKSRG